MENIEKYKINFLCEFVDKDLELEFLNNEMRRYAKIIGPVTIIFGIIYMMFFISDYFTIENSKSIMIIFLIRALFLFVSVVVYIAVKKIDNYVNLAYLISFYELLAIIAFIVILYQYEFLTVLSFFSVVAMMLAIYIIPNKLINSLFIATVLSLSFFIFPAKNIAGIDTAVFLKIIAYDLIILVYCNIGSFLTNFYKRKQFADSRELLRVSITDTLTGIYNRAKFNEELNRWIEYCRRYENPLSLVIFDIDDFKKVNDNHGHFIGDHVLQSIALLIKDIIRNTDIFARWGGEEFVILFPNTEIQQAVEITERIRIFIEKSKYDKVENVTCSFGLVTLRKDEDAESFLKRADNHLYNAKNYGKNIVISEACII